MFSTWIDEQKAVVDADKRLLGMSAHHYSRGWERERGRDRKGKVMYWASAMFERGCAPERARKRPGGEWVGGLLGTILS